MNRRARNRTQLRDALGADVYEACTWLADEQVAAANAARAELLSLVSPEVEHSFAGNKLHLGTLSPGCVLCGEGLWSCAYVTRRCNADCFYCTYDKEQFKRQSDAPGSVSTDGFSVRTPEDYADALARFGFRGVSFSGGEPFLAFDKVLDYIAHLRKTFGSNLYIWVYTNGRLADETRLEALQRAGLDELRFDIAAADYDLTSIDLARRYIGTITVEIPAIPEDREIVQHALAEIQSLGVGHVNLHQLIGTSSNYKRLAARHYTFLHDPSFAILESELTALAIIKYAIDAGLSLPIQYCSATYKNRLQSRGRRNVGAGLVAEDYEDLTEAGYIRSLSIKDAPNALNGIVEDLKSNRCPDKRWLLNAAAGELHIHSELLKFVDFARHDLTITYLRPETTERHADPPAYESVVLDAHNTLYLHRETAAQYRLGDPLSIDVYRKLFVDAMDRDRVLYDLWEQSFVLSDRCLREVNALQVWEEVPAGVPEFY